MKDKGWGLNHLSNDNSKNDQADPLYHTGFKRKELCGNDIYLIAKQLGKANIEGEGWRCLCPAHNDHNPSLSLFWDKTTRNLLARCWAGCTFVEIMDAFKMRGLFSGDQLKKGNVNSSLITPVAPNTANRREEVAVKVWNDCISPKGSLVDRYLKSRGYHGWIPPTIKYSPKLYHSPSSVYYPAMVSSISLWPNKSICGIHRTYLSRDGSGKALIYPNKMMLGNTKGGAVRLSPPGSLLYVTEGIETALSIYAATQLPTWATLSTSGMVNVKVPPMDITQEIIIAADNDIAGKKAADKLANRLASEGYKVQIALPPPGMDFNDMLRRQV